MVGFLSLIPLSGQASDSNSIDIASPVELHGTVAFEHYPPVDTLELSPDDVEPRSLEQLQASLKEPLEAETRLPPLLPLQHAFNPQADRLEKASTLLLVFGNGVFHNMESRESAKDNLMANLKQPFKRIAYGWSYDNDSFRTNFIEHPVLWFGYATYLKSKGASDKEAFLVSQTANLLWEGVLEGTYVPPSGKDLLTDLISSVAGIYLYNKGPGKAIGQKVLQLEGWAAKRNIKLKPAFSYNPYTRGGRAGTELILTVR